jgi:hypothetical protein
MPDVSICLQGILLPEVTCRFTPGLMLRNLPPSHSWAARKNALICLRFLGGYPPIWITILQLPVPLLLASGLAPTGRPPDPVQQRPVHRPPGCRGSRSRLGARKPLILAPDDDHGFLSREGYRPVRHRSSWCRRQATVTPRPPARPLTHQKLFFDQAVKSHGNVVRVLFCHFFEPVVVPSQRQIVAIVHRITFF